MTKLMGAQLKQAQGGCIARCLQRHDDKDDEEEEDGGGGGGGGDGDKVKAVVEVVKSSLQSR